MQKMSRFLHIIPQYNWWSGNLCGWVFLALLTPWSVQKLLLPHLRISYSFAWMLSPQPWWRWLWLPHGCQSGLTQWCFQALLCWKSFWANVLFFKWWGNREEEIIHKHTKLEVVSMNVSAWTALWSYEVAEECSCFIFPCISSEANKTNRNVNSVSFCAVLVTAYASQTYFRKKLILNAKAKMTLNTSSKGISSLQVYLKLFFWIFTIHHKSVCLF